MSRRNRILLILAAVIVIDVVAFIVFPPFDPIRGRTPAELRLPGLLHQRQPRAAGARTPSSRPGHHAPTASSCST